MPDLVKFNVIPKDFFFDRAKIVDPFQRGRRAAMAKIGAFIMVRARSITGHRSKKSAQPGQPPRKHAGTLSEKIFFAAADSSWETVAVGPLVFRSSRQDEADAPGLLEQGGQTTLWLGKRGRQRVTFHKFPYMGPSLEEAKKNNKLSEAWAGVIRP